jgi:hypothetical protein
VADLKRWTKKLFLMPKLNVKSHATFLVLLCLLVAGCATVPPPIPSELQYRPPVAGVETATIVGSQENSAWADDFTAYITGIDRKRVVLERKGWSTPIVLVAGTRALTAEFRRGVFHTQVEIPLMVESGRSYRLKFSSDVGINGRNTYCDFWIEDLQTGKAVSGIVRGSISGGGGGTFVPIFIPVK